MIAYSKISIRKDTIVTMKDDRVFLLTGAAGFLGNNIAKQLMEKGCYVRGLVLKGDKAVKRKWNWAIKQDHLMKQFMMK